MILQRVCASAASTRARVVRGGVTLVIHVQQTRARLAPGGLLPEYFMSDGVRPPLPYELNTIGWLVPIVDNRCSIERVRSLKPSQHDMHDVAGLRTRAGPCTRLPRGVFVPNATP